MDKTDTEINEAVLYTPDAMKEAIVEAVVLRKEEAETETAE